MEKYETGERIKIDAILTGEHLFESGYGYDQWFSIYTMKDQDGNVLIWKTSASLSMDIPDKDGGLIPDPVRKGDSFRLKATVKGHGEYNGKPQTILTRVKVLSITHAMTKAKRDAIKAKEQLCSLMENDFVWTMPYRQFKEHYPDCETIAGSYDPDYRTIDVIIREGRLVPNGTRFQHYSGYEFTDEFGLNVVCYRAISEETARKRLAKDWPDMDWKLTRIYEYGKYKYNGI